MNLGEFFFMILSFTGAAVVSIWTLALAVAYVRRAGAKSTVGGGAAEDLDAVRDRLAGLEQREVRLAELEERLDFMERALGRVGEGKRLHQGPDAPR